MGIDKNRTNHCQSVVVLDRYAAKRPAGWQRWHGDTQRYNIKPNDTEHNDNQQNETQHNDTRYNDTQHNDTEHNDTEHNDTEHNETQHNMKKALLW